MKRFICFILEAVMLSFIFTFSWSIDAPNYESKASLEASPAQHVVFRTNASSSELPFELISKGQFAVNEQLELFIDISSIEIATSDGVDTGSSIRNPFYSYTTINAP